MECPNCHAENREGARFCRMCGARLQPIPITDQSPGGAEDRVEARIRETESLPSPPGREPAVSVPTAATAPDQQPSFFIEASAPAPESAPLASEQEAISDVEPATVSAAAVTQASPAPALRVLEAVPQLEAGSLAPEPGQRILEPLLPGAIVAGRFEITEVLEAGSDANLYQARDLARCPSCGATGNPPGELFCVECGVDLKSAGPSPLCRLREAPSAEGLGVPPEEVVADGQRFYLPLPPQPGSAAMPATPQQPTPRVQALAIGYASHAGMRELDEDSLCAFTLAGVYESVADPLLGLFIVADGMGGHEGGEVASKMTVQLVARGMIRRLLLRHFLGEFQGQAAAVLALLPSIIAEANKKIYDLAQERSSDMGSTITLALIMNGTAYIANVGDSRTYIYRQGKLRQITTDHSLVASLVQAGVLAPEEIFTHPDRNVIYRSLGAKPTVEVDTFEEPLAPGDTLLLCCDGLWEAIRDEGIEEVLLAYPDPQSACTEMIRRANLAGGEDNISVIVVTVTG